MSFSWKSVLFVCVAGLPGITLAQTSFPIPPRVASNDDWATSSPERFDEAEDESSMSPDHWGGLEGGGDFVFPPARPENPDSRNLDSPNISWPNAPAPKAVPKSPASTNSSEKATGRNNRPAGSLGNPPAATGIPTTPSIPDLTDGKPFNRPSFGPRRRRPRQQTTLSNNSDARKNGGFSQTPIREPYSVQGIGRSTQGTASVQKYPLPESQGFNLPQGSPATGFNSDIPTDYRTIRNQIIPPAEIASPKATQPFSPSTIMNQVRPASPGRDSYPRDSIIRNANEKPQSDGLGGFGWSPKSPANTPSNPNPGQSPYYQPTPQLDFNAPGQPAPVVRYHGGQESSRYYPFEDKTRRFIPVSEMIENGRFFLSGGASFLQPGFQSNTAIATTGGATAQNLAFDFDYSTSPVVKIGFQSARGQGVELNYWKFGQTSNESVFTSDGTEVGTARSWMLGPGQWSVLTAASAGETLRANHRLDADSFGISFFSEARNPNSRVVGKFGLQWISLTQSMSSVLSNSGGTIGQLDSRTNLNGFGPSGGIEYYSRIGNSNLEWVTSANGALLFGRRDQSIQNSLASDFVQADADEFLANAGLFLGVQYMKMVAETRGYYVRIGMDYQAWLGGGSAVNPDTDFGLRGFSISLGYNR